ncbi:glycosyltransferase [Microbacterium esteraromaticum]|uniref:Glycosyltransferase n=1 Tax=Microbacterium esteraromaticum TaxID=57043 RepID=A0A939IUE4_9MICO|nr:glycosyltransferase [Microbacterium esteraromaticum]MBN8205326.1 glycosyltransferase [Microbacterium esteraromaticum]MBN8415480.1 glycosyltransferase [Microbacterium esteraromaticum]MBN8424167.1 glycosyltransferase [Microbacterium esteraromaticum]
MTDLVVVSLEAWDDVWRRNQYLVSGLLARDPELRVLFVEPSDDPLHAVRGGSRPSFGHAPREVMERLWTFRPVKPLPRRVDRAADARIARAVIRAAQRLGMSQPLLWINDPGAAAVAQLTDWPTLYDMTDDWVVADRPDAERARLVGGEEWLLQHAASVVACSPELVRRKSGQRDDIVLVRNAVDVERYRVPMERPADLPAGRTAVYVGTLHRDRLDVELCVETARALGAEGTLVLVGPNALGVEDTAALQRNGVVVLGAKPRDAVPAYLQHADVLVVPHVVTDFTESLDPIKLYEYQAVGKPVVSTPVAGFRDAPNVVVGNASSSFSGEVADLLARLAADSLEAMASTDALASAGWTDRVDQLREVFEKLITPTSDRR